MHANHGPTWDLIVIALAHLVGDETERAYLRSDAFNKRRLMMQKWADFCDKDQQAITAQVGPIRAA
jgi:hypothetical protein